MTPGVFLDRFLDQRGTSRNTLLNTQRFANRPAMSLPGNLFNTLFPLPNSHSLAVSRQTLSRLFTKLNSNRRNPVSRIFHHPLFQNLLESWVYKRVRELPDVVILTEDTSRIGTLGFSSPLLSTSSLWIMFFHDSLCSCSVLSDSINSSCSSSAQSFLHRLT